MSNRGARPRGEQMQWNAQQVTILTNMFNSNCSLKTIMDYFGISKNSALGKLHRLGLYYFKRDKDGKYTGVRRSARKRREEREARALADDEIRLAMARAPMPTPTRTRVEPCCWVLGMNKPARYCDVPSEPGRPYCLSHCRMAYEGFGRPRKGIVDSAVMS